MSDGDTRPWSIGADGATIKVRVTPKSSRDRVEGIEATAQGAALKVRVRAAPDKGAANAAVTETIAEWLGIPKSRVTLVSGATARIKTIAVAGDAAQLAVQLERRLAATI